MHTPVDFGPTNIDSGASASVSPMPRRAETISTTSSTSTTAAERSPLELGLLNGGPVGWPSYRASAFIFDRAAELTRKREKLRTVFNSATVLRVHWLSGSASTGILVLAMANKHKSSWDRDLKQHPYITGWRIWNSCMYDINKNRLNRSHHRIDPFITHAMISKFLQKLSRTND
jgi:hypothetical protein